MKKIDLVQTRVTCIYGLLPKTGGLWTTPKITGVMLDAREKRRTNDEGRASSIENPVSRIWLICGVRMCINILSAAENAGIAEFDFFSAVSAISAVNLSVSHLALECCHE